jgi:hypothetical protein
MPKLRRRFWLEAVLCAAFLVLTVVTLVNPEWIEAVFRVDPDRGSGALEWGIVAATGVAALVTAALAGVEWRRGARLAT